MTNYSSSINYGKEKISFNVTIQLRVDWIIPLLPKAPTSGFAKGGILPPVTEWLHLQPVLPALPYFSQLYTLLSLTCLF